nr:MAG TPA: helix-turn-helix domain protein [Herelleviridae sp.]
MGSETFIERLERLMEDKGLQQKDLAEQVGISSNGISTWKITGALPRADIAVKIARILGVTVEYLVTGELSNLEYSQDNELAYEVAGLSKEQQNVIKALVNALKVL